MARITAKGVIPFRGSGKILDVGCGGGAYLYRLKQWGWETYGVEPSETGARQAQSLGLNVKRAVLDGARFETSYFDVIRLSNVVEHLPDPKANLSRNSSHPETRRVRLSDRAEHAQSGILFIPRKLVRPRRPAPPHILLAKNTDRSGARCRFKIAQMNFAAGPFNLVGSMKYLAEERGERWPQWLRQVRWERSKLIRRSLKPFFFFIDSLGYGDFLHVTLCKEDS